MAPRRHSFPFSCGVLGLISFVCGAWVVDCYGKNFENWSSTIPPGRFHAVAVIAGGDTRNALRRAMQVRNDLREGGIETMKVSGRWKNTTQAMSEICSPSAPQAVDGMVVVQYDYVVLYDCKTSKAAFEMQGSSEADLKPITNHLIRYIKRPPGSYPR